jgi:hypothetical protein
LSERGSEINAAARADEARRPPPAGGDKRGSRARGPFANAPAPAAQTIGGEERDLINAMPGGRNFQ